MSDACNDLYNALNTPMHIDLDIILTTRTQFLNLVQRVLAALRV